MSIFSSHQLEGMILILMQQLQTHTHKTNSQFKGKLALLEVVLHSLSEFGLLHRDGCILWQTEKSIIDQ